MAGLLDATGSGVACHAMGPRKSVYSLREDLQVSRADSGTGAWGGGRTTRGRWIALSGSGIGRSIVFHSTPCQQ